MIRDELRRLVKFDPDEVRKAIRTCDEEAQALYLQREEVLALADTYRKLLKTHGFEDIPYTQPPEIRRGESLISGGSDRRFRNAKIADAVVTVLSENAGKLHGQKILKALQAGGLKVGGKYPMSTLVTAMRRDSRIEKDPDEKNTWKLRR